MLVMDVSHNTFIQDNCTFFSTWSTMIALGCPGHVYLLFLAKDFHETRRQTIPISKFCLWPKLDETLRSKPDSKMVTAWGGYKH